MIDPEIDFDELRVKDLILKFKEELMQCQRIDYGIIEFFNKKSNFRIRDDLVKFAKKFLKYNLSPKNRTLMNEEIARVAIQNKYNLEKLSKLIKKEVLESKPQRISKNLSVSSTKPKKSMSKVSLEDQMLRWILLPIIEVRRELNDLTKYPDSKSLKQASYSILTINEKRLRKREKIINVIIDHLEENKALAKFGG